MEFGSSGKCVAGAGPSDHDVDDVNFVVSEVYTLHVIRLYAGCFYPVL
jgi:hypothetical protein